MKNKIFFFAGILIGIFLIGFVVAQTCSPAGKINYTSKEFCNFDQEWELQKQDTAICINNYECLVGFCIEGICQSKYEPLVKGLEEQTGILQNIFNFLSGVDCSAGQEKCEDTEWFMCDVGNWVSQGLVDGECGYVAPDEDECDAGENKCDSEILIAICGEDGMWGDEINDYVDGKCGYEVSVVCTEGEKNCAADGMWISVCEGGVSVPKNIYVDGVCGYSTPITPPAPSNDHSGPSGASMVIDFISPKNGFTYSSLTIPLQVKDTRNRAKFWKYSLNGGSKVSFTPNTSIQAVLGSNSLEVYASASSSFSSEVKKKISFSVIQNSNGVCGNDICDVNEDCATCSDDCGGCFDLDLSRCGDGVCDTGEISSTCPDDCDTPKNYRWLWVSFFIIVILGVLVALSYAIYRRRKQKQVLGGLGSVSKIPEYS